MKKLFIAAIVAVFIGTTAFADPTSVNHKVLTSFTSDFRGAENVNWKMSEQFVRASFIYDEREYEAFYNYEGDLLGTSRAYAFDKLPKNALETIATKYPYPPYKLKECIQYTNADGEKSFFLSFEKGAETLVLQISLEGAVSEFKKM
jgi:hypothetical protein